MQIRAILLYFLLITALSVVGCMQPGDPAAEEPLLKNPYQELEPRGQNAGPSSPTMAIMEFSPIYLDDRQEVAKRARADLLIVTASEIYDRDHNENGVAALKSINPDIKVLAYTLAHSSLLQWGESPPGPGQQDRYTYDWFIETRPYWSYTTAGDTMMAWYGQVLLNILDPGCREAMIGVIAKHHTIQSNRISGVYWDHFVINGLWVPNDLEGVEGEMDLDGDGIPHPDDPDEIAAYLQAAHQLVTGLRAAVGEDFIQIANGSYAAKDSTFAALLDGMMYEWFPRYKFTGANLWASALDPTVYNNLFAARNWPRTRNGGPWLILTSREHFYFVDDAGEMTRYSRAEFCRVVALLTDAAVSYHPEAPVYLYGWPEVELDLGYPMGGVDREGNVLRRDFVNGQVIVTLTDNTDIPMEFEIIQDGQVIQSFAYPAHYP